MGLEYMFGSGILYGFPNAGNLAANPTPTRFGTLQDVALDISGDIKELYGQFQLPVDVARGKMKLTAKAKFAYINGKVFNDLFFAAAMAAGMVRWAQGEPHTIPPTPGPYTITIAPPLTGVFKNDYGVIWGSGNGALTGTSFQRVPSGPTTGEYSVDEATGIYTFAAADQGKAVAIDYSFTLSAVGVSIPINNQLMGYSPQFQLVLNHQYHQNSFSWVFNAAIASKLSYATKLDDYTIPELDISMFVDAAGSLGTIYSDQ